MKDGKPGKGKGAQKHAARKTAGGAPRQKPLAILDKVSSPKYNLNLFNSCVGFWKISPMNRGNQTIKVDDP